MSTVEPSPGSNRRMFRHVVLLTFKQGTTRAQQDAVLAGLEGLPGQIPEIRRYHFGLDAGIAAGNASLAIVADFEDQADYQSYATNPVHLQLIAETIKPVLSARSAVQFEDD